MEENNKDLSLMMLSSSGNSEDKKETLANVKVTIEKTESDIYPITILYDYYREADGFTYTFMTSIPEKQITIECLRITAIEHCAVSNFPFKQLKLEDGGHYLTRDFFVIGER